LAAQIIMKAKLFISVAWVVGTFLLLSWMLYAANDYDRSMLEAVTGQPGVQPTLGHVKALETQKREAKTLEEASAIQGMIWEEFVRYLKMRNAAFSQRRMIDRAWILWGVSAFVPLLFIWSSPLSGLWRRIQPGSQTHEKARDRRWGGSQ
jgi:hypothetical protein